MTRRPDRKMSQLFRFRFVTSTPLNIIRGSGTFAGIGTLAKFLQISGHTVNLVTPTLKFPVYTVERIVFNEMLRFRPQPAKAVTVGFDMDGYTIAGRGGLHVASIKGVIADEMRFESGLTHATMRLQARCERLHVQRANLVIAPSRYSADKIQQLYEISQAPRVVPEPIDLENWQSLLKSNPAQPADGKFTVLTVCRFYPRKRLPILLAAAGRLRRKIPGLEFRIVGDGPEAGRLKSICRNKNLLETVTWLGNLSQADLAREYNRCHIFCLPSVQESFGIVFLEAMASGKPIVAARAAAVPEVVKHGILVEPDNDEALADGIGRLHADPALRTVSATQAREWVKQFDAPLIAAIFLRELTLTLVND
ncbi:MAG: glycosyltransferase family 4 protein [Candidatus Sulfotelmatobacter sp.]